MHLHEWHYPVAALDDGQLLLNVRVGISKRGGLEMNFGFP